MRKVPVSAAIAAAALAVGSLSAVGGVLNARASCEQIKHTNAAVRNLVDDFVKQNPAVTPEEKAKADATTLARFPDHC